MKLLVVADLHYSLPQFDWLLGAAPDYDAIIIAGDLLETSSMVDPGAQVVVVRKYLQRMRAVTKVIICSGNHDLDEIGKAGEKFAHWVSSAKRLRVLTDGETTVLGQTLITACPWWDGPDSRAAIATQLAAAAQLRVKEWLWIYHAPPTNSPTSWSGQRSFGDPALSEWIAKYSPDLVFCGHVHEAPFARGGSWADRIGGTWVFNAGRQIGPVPTHIALDTDAAEAAWFSFEGAEAVNLAAPLVRPIEPLSAMPAWMKS